MIERAIALAKGAAEKANALWRDEDQLELRFESARPLRGQQLSQAR